VWAFDIINEAEENRLVFLAVRDALKRHAAFRGSRTLLAEVGGGSTSLTLLRRGEPNRSGVYALGSVRLRQQLDLRRHSQEIQMALLRRYVANIIEEIRVEIPWSWFVRRRLECAFGEPSTR
jgi:exopolyphosphatase/pppGpp-phosphohydrolase